MTDVRALLRTERSSRRVTHPHASYTTAGKLVCIVCKTQIKNESQWNNHLASQQHSKSLQELRSATSVSSSKKRKADASEDDGRKRVRSSENDAQDLQPDEQVEQDVEEPDNGQSALSVVPDHPTPSESSEIDHLPTASDIKPIQPANTAPSAPEITPLEEDEEWLAFQREIEAADIPPAQSSAVKAAATISAAPMTAEEIAVQAREEQSTQRGRRDEEIEGEKEDAARALEDEFQEMEQLEDRVRRLREKREALRAGKDTNVSQAVVSESEGIVSKVGNGGEWAEPSEIKEDMDDDEDEDDEDFDDWKFGAT